ncbi:hypothetical protein D3C78_1815400 [compost metagenome]
MKISKSAGREAGRVTRQNAFQSGIRREMATSSSSLGSCLRLVSAVIWPTV